MLGHGDELWLNGRCPAVIGRSQLHNAYRRQQAIVGLGSCYLGWRCAHLIIPEAFLKNPEGPLSFTHGSGVWPKKGICLVGIDVPSFQNHLYYFRMPVLSGPHEQRWAISIDRLVRIDVPSL